MKIQDYLKKQLQEAVLNKKLVSEPLQSIDITPCKQKAHGDLASLPPRGREGRGPHVPDRVAGGGAERGRRVGGVQQPVDILLQRVRPGDEGDLRR